MYRPLHLVAFDIPYPPNYGGIIDVFYKIKALYETGVEIHLHCFQYRGKKPAPELEQFCKTVHYYPRQLSLKAFFHIRPFIVQTRQMEALLGRLAEAPYPILFEGLHTCAFISHPALRDRKKLVRMHNIEWQYYQHLARLEKKVTRSFYLFIESMKLRRYEPHVLQHADIVLPISPADEQYFISKGHSAVHLLPAFHGHRALTIREGKGAYALFHGNLSVPDNDLAVRFLIKKVFRDMDYPLYVAGRAPSDKLVKLCRRHPHVRLFPNPSNDEMEKLIQAAHIHLLYTFQSDGTKIKLLESLFAGRFCVANKRMVLNTKLDKLCRMADSATEIRRVIQELREQPFCQEDVELRRQVLSECYVDRKGARIILDCLGFPEEN